jgi:predicted site-specific integrase-resolvase
MIERMCENRSMKLAVRASANGVRPQIAYRWFRHGTMPVPAMTCAKRPRGLSGVEAS